MSDAWFGALGAGALGAAALVVLHLRLARELDRLEGALSRLRAPARTGVGDSRLR